MKYTPISISPEQAQFLETRKFQLDEIARIFRVPPHMIGDLEKSSFNNIEQQSLEFVKYTLDPWVSRWEQSMVRSLLSREEKSKYFIKFNVDGLLRGDYQSRMNGYATARQNGWMSANVETANFALLFEFDGDVKKIRHVLYNCSAARPNIESATNEEEIEVQTETLAITAAPLANGYVKARTGDSTTDTVYTGWYTAVYLPEVTPDTSGTQQSGQQGTDDETGGETL